ncbi:hypothetical protein [Janthinobacterium lividum]|uniref:hypothetical protein n=1 Tax=Janthinobacterium lividum TaxID=29581 RepID=UPI000452D6B3|nr:hypothetical protein [Janthinobacterium lividum]EZP41149.1 hypothetical protein BW37_01098 [Janthinobacterium lividum]
MMNISTVGIQPGALSVAQGNKTSSDKTSSDQAQATRAPAGAGAVADDVVISTLAGRLSKAATATSATVQGYDHAGLGVWVKDNTTEILYPLDAEHKAAAARQVPEPNDAASAKSAAAATAFVDRKGPNPFAGLSREQLSTISNDDSGTFTINERRAAFTQAYDEEQAWRTQVVTQAMQEYNSTGKMTNFFKSVLGHFSTLPQLEQSQYPASYASDLDDKIKLDFNYFNHAAGDGGPTPGSLADLLKNQGKKTADLFDLLIR